MGTLEVACYRQGDFNLSYTRNFYVTDIFDSIDDTANICHQFKLKFSTPVMTVKQGGAAYSRSRKISRSRTYLHSFMQLLFVKYTMEYQGDPKITDKKLLVYTSIKSKNTPNSSVGPFFP